MQAGDDKSYDDINVTPMVDLYLVLLLIFIIMTTAAVQGLKVNLPKAGGKPEPPDPSKPKLQAVVLDDAGKIKLNDKPTTLQELETQLTALKTKWPDVPVVVRGDSNTQYQQVMNVLNMVNRLGISNLGLATKATQ